MSKKHSIISRYVAHIGRSPKYVQQVHALIFSGAITLLLAFFILYFDYGFWHDGFARQETVTSQVESKKIEQSSESPSSMFTRFLGEAAQKAKNVQAGGSVFLEGKKSYSQKEEFLLGTSSNSSSTSSMFETQ